MKLSILERLLVAERVRPKVSVGTGAIVPPIVTARQVSPDEAPFMANKVKGGFTLTRPNNHYGLLQAYTGCPVEMEDVMFQHLYRTLWLEGGLHGWNNRFPTLDAALAGMDPGLPPKVAAVSFETLREIAGNDLTEEEAERVTLAKGCVVEVHGVRILSARGALPKGSAILATTTW